jgi:hypothetical protein
MTKSLDHEKHILHLTKVTFLTKCQVEDLVKMDKWPWVNQIGHIEWIGFSQIDHIEWIRFSQIDHLNLILSQMNHTHLIT